MERFDAVGNVRKQRKNRRVAIKRNPLIRKGVAYFKTFNQAREFAAHHVKGFPAWRIVDYQLGFAIQVRPGGDYIGADGLPSMVKRKMKNNPLERATRVAMKRNPIFRVTHNFNVSQPSWSAQYYNLFGKENEGFLIEGETVRDAINRWNASRREGERLNPYYLKIVPEKIETLHSPYRRNLGFAYAGRVPVHPIKHVSIGAFRNKFDAIKFARDVASTHRKTIGVEKQGKIWIVRDVTKAEKARRA